MNSKNKKNLVFVAVSLIFVLLFYSLGKQIYDSLQAGNRLSQAASKLQSLQSKNSDLKKKLQQTSSLNFVEEQARDKLNLSRPGETVMIISQKEIDNLVAQERVVVKVQLPYWQGWLQLFGIF